MATKPGLILRALPLAALLAACGNAPAQEAAISATPLPAAAPPAAEGPGLWLLAPRRVRLSPVGEAGARRLWRGEGNIALAMDGARVVATAGLPRIVMATRFDGPDPLADPRALLGQEARARRTVDLAGADRDPGSMRFGVRLDCVLRARPQDGWILVEEDCQGEGLSFTNRFWSDPRSGAVRQSEQGAGEGIGPLTIGQEGS